MERKPRIPTQKRALEKVDKIVAAAFKLFNEKGYYNITTADIANESGVATGSVYAYFEDKKAIYIQVLQKVHESFIHPTRDFWTKNIVQLDNPENTKEMFSLFLKLMLASHNFSKLFHDEMEALKLLDEDIKKECLELDSSRLELTKEVFDMISLPFISPIDEEIFIHYSILLIDDLCHTILYDATVKDAALYMDKCSYMLYSLIEVSTITSKTN